MRALITGGSGQLGYDLAKVYRQAGHEVIVPTRAQMDLSNQQSIVDFVNGTRPELILHAAANTNVDGCEYDPDQAYLINALATRSLAVSAQEIGATIVYYSTDYVFNGTKGQPYHEWDQTAPINVYGHSKWVGEEMVRSFSSKHFILRTSWVFGINGHNFIKTMLKLATEKDKLQVVDDQIGSPTYCPDLAQFTLQLTKTNRYGTYHATNSGHCSWFELAEYVLTKKGFIKVKLEPTNTESLSRPAPRPHFSVLDNYVARLEGFALLPPWKNAVERYFKELTTEF